MSSLLHRVRELITALRPVEVEVLEKMLTNEESVNSSTPVEQSLDQTILVKDEKQQPSLRCSSSDRCGGGKPKRRHSDPSLRRSHCTKDEIVSSNVQTPPGDESLRQSMSTLSLVPAIIDSSSINGCSGAKNSCSPCEGPADRRSVVQCRSSNCRRSSALPGLSSATTTSTSCHSIETSCSASSTIDSFELALAVAAKSSPFISPGTRQLLHRLFITIAGEKLWKYFNLHISNWHWFVAGVADQLQSNCANDLRIILRQVFKMHTESTVDNVSVEEALEAKEESNSASSSSTTTSTAGTPTDTSDNSFNFPMSGPSSLPNSPIHDHHNQHRHQDSSSGPSDDQDIDPILIAPVWVADELVSNCNSCGQSFNLIRRRHHCRNCGHIFCNPCSNHYVPLTQFGYNDPVRVCDLCFRSYPIHGDHITSMGSSVNNADHWSWSFAPENNAPKNEQ